jgi:muramoyltetrapeptide carboxypeptidase
MPTPVKPPALQPGAALRIVSTASPVEQARLDRGCEELGRLGYRPEIAPNALARVGYFAGLIRDRIADLMSGFSDPGIGGMVCARGGFGTSGLLDHLEVASLPAPRVLVGHSDVTCLQVFLWQRKGWTGFYGPMAAAGFDAGAGAPNGYDQESFLRAVSETRRGWSLDLAGECLTQGEAEGPLLGGCLTIVRSTIGTQWELDTDGAILLLEDRAMKPYQVDRALTHLRQAGKFRDVRGVILGDFPECEPPAGSDITVRHVAERVLDGLGVPVVYGVPFGHTTRPMLTLPLGVRARLSARGAGTLEILEPAVA